MYSFEFQRLFCHSCLQGGGFELSIVRLCPHPPPGGSVGAPLVSALNEPFMLWRFASPARAAFRLEEIWKLLWTNGQINKAMLGMLAMPSTSKLPSWLTFHVGLSLVICQVERHTVPNLTYRCKFQASVKRVGLLQTALKYLSLGMWISFQFWVVEIWSHNEPYVEIFWDFLICLLMSFDVFWCLLQGHGLEGVAGVPKGAAKWSFWSGRWRPWRPRDAFQRATRSAATCLAFGAKSLLHDLSNLSLDFGIHSQPENLSDLDQFRQF